MCFNLDFGIKNTRRMCSATMFLQGVLLFLSLFNDVSAGKSYRCSPIVDFHLFVKEVISKPYIH